MKLSDLLDNAKPVLDKILEQNFIQEMAAGSLSKQRFVFYLEQDYLFLNTFAKSLALAAIKLEHNHHSQRFLNLALETINAEQEFHRDHLVQYHINPETIIQSPACFNYANFLISTTSIKPVSEAIAAIAPCFWIYQEVGKYLANVASESNPYHDWIAVYSDDDFQQTTASVLDTLDFLMRDLAAHKLQKVNHTFIIAAKLEWLFFEGAYQMQQWPI